MSDRDWPAVSIVFLAYNRREELSKSLDKVLHELDYPADRLEVIVVDNASSDGTAGMVRADFPEVQLIRNAENVGASAWNNGMTTAQGDWRMILDDDCFISGDALKTAVSRAEEAQADLVSFRVMSGVEPGYCFNDEYQTGLITFWGCSAMFSRRAIETEPFYDPQIFIWANEMELTMRLLDRGFRHLYLPEVESIHMKAPSPPFSERGIRVNHRHFAYIAAKLLQPRDAAAAFGNLVLHSLFAILSLDPRAVLAVPEAVRGFAKGLRYREPVRPEVSTVYRNNVWHFTNPVTVTRSPLARLRSKAGPEAQMRERERLIERWYENREQFYPDGGVLQI
jgi:GT2 family glycosyltransferase